ncbi:hypothetical protein MMC14_006630, partial [Varicellaria rhodocarpa]|nr:hypothetical protein [Varicellaria rhodocarpa]
MSLCQQLAVHYSSRAPTLGYRPVEPDFGISLAVAVSLGEGWFYLFLPTFNDSGVGPAISHAYLTFSNADIDATIGCIKDETTVNGVEYGFFVNG